MILFIIFTANAISMNSLSSLLFYIPFILIVTIDPNSQDIGLWSRYATLSVLGLISIVVYRNELKNSVTSLSLMALALILFLVKIGDVSAQSELFAFVARMSFLGAWVMIARAAFSDNKPLALKAIGTGSQIALIFVCLSLVPSIIEAYQEGNMYLAHGPFFTHKNYAAATILILLPLSLVGKFKNGAALWAVSLVLSGIIIILLQTRGVWLGALVMAVIAAIHFLTYQNKGYGIISLISLGVLTVGIGLAVFMTGSERLLNSDTIQSRMHYWNASTEMFLDQPISGVGGGQWKIEYPAKGLKGTNESVMNGQTSILRPHNDLLWMASETGVFGALLFVCIMFIGFWKNFKPGGNIFMALVIVAFSVYGFGEFPLERASMLWPLAVALGFASSTMKSKLKSTIHPFFGAALILFTLVLSFYRIRGERFAKKSLDEGYMKSKARIMQTNAESAQSIFFEMDIYNNPMAYFEGLGILSSNGNRPNQRDVNRAQEAFERALDIHPNHMLTLNQLASIHRMKGELNEAAALYDEVLEMSPRNITAALKQIEVQRTLGDIYASLDALKMIGPQYNPQNLNGLGPEATKTLQVFAKSKNPRPSLKGLHQQLQGVKPKNMWSVWANWRKNRG